MHDHNTDGRPPLIQYWHSGEAPDDVAELLAGFATTNPELEHRLFDRGGAEELIAARFGERELAAFRACAVPAMQADYFRYCAAHALGGVYADADFRCQAPLRPLLADPATATLFGRPELPARWRNETYEWRERIGPYRVIMNSFFAFPEPGHPLLELAIEIATANVEGRVAEDVALVTGPAVFTSLYLLRELGSFDAFRRYAEGGPLAGFASDVCEAVGDHGRVARAFEGVELRPEAETHDFVGPPDPPLSYKRTADHWLNATAGIYR